MGQERKRGDWVFAHILWKNSPLSHFAQQKGPPSQAALRDEAFRGA
jgi:hypothetical protein